MHTMATRYSVSALPPDHCEAGHFTIEVEWRGAGRWAVCRHRMCLGTDGEWDFESVPTERAEKWLAAHRFDLHTAMRLAREAAPGLTVNGFTVADVIGFSR